MGYRLLRDRQNGLWVGTIGEGLWRVLPPKEEGQWAVERITLNTGLTSNSVQSVVEDRDGNVWVGTTAGLHRLSRRKLTPVGDVGLAISLDALPTGEMLVGTSSELLAFRRTAGNGLQRRLIAASQWVVTSQHDESGSVWVTTTEGAYRVSGERLQAVPGLEGRPVRFVASSAAAGVWFGSDDALYRIDSGRAVPFDLPRAWRIGRISTLFADSQGGVWVTATDGRAVIVRGDGTHHAFGAADGLKAGSAINRVFEDREHTIWLATDAGLGRFTGTRFEFVGQAQGLPTDRIGAVVDDHDGQLWLNIDVGLLRLDRTEFTKAVATPGYRPRYRVYDASEGLSGAAIVQVKADRSADGTLWFVRGGGLTFVDPRQLDVVGPPRQRVVRIDGALADDRKLPATEVVSIQPGVKTLQISYSALELTSPQRLRFRYRLDGFDLGWTEAGTRRQAFYTNLPPRDYMFRVEAQMDGESWVDAATWRFAIQPMFYQTAWFYGVVAGGLLLAVWGAWHVRLRVVRHEFTMVLAERTRLSREIHDTLLQSLVGLTLQINKVARNVVASPAEAASQLVRMRKQVEAYIRDARTSIWDLRSPLLETRDLPTALQEVGSRAASDHSVQFTSKVVGQQRRVSPKVENHLLRIGQEAITNAVRHANAARIELELHFDETWLSLRVKDDGRGFEVQSVDRRDGHYGLTSMRERAMEIGAQFTVSSAPETGTEVLTTVPLGVQAAAHG
jgi:streptogramin lyase